jgi:hypothetical protein
MRQRPIQDDLMMFSRTETSDEQRLLTHYRDSPWEDRTELLYRIARLRFAPSFAESFDRDSDACDSTYLHEELEQELREQFPRDFNSAIAQIYDCLTNQQFAGIFQDLENSGWPSIARVILGGSEQDGRRADELYEVIHNASKSVFRCAPPNFSRRDTLELIEVWREQVLQKLFRYQCD